MIALASVYRKNAGTQYLELTLKSLVRHIQNEERDEVCILIYAADFNDHLRAKIVR